jgi:formate dehydrogenase major subunit
VRRPPLLRQLTEDRLALRRAARSARSEKLRPRTAEADRMVQSVCPYCAVGCGQRVYVKDERVIQIEGDPDSPISRGRLCPKGSASKSLATHPGRLDKVRYRRPYGTE